MVRIAGSKDAIAAARDFISNKNARVEYFSDFSRFLALKVHLNNLLIHVYEVLAADSLCEAKDQGFCLVAIDLI